MTFASILLLIGAVVLGVLLIVGFCVACLILSWKWFLKTLREEGFYD